MTDAAVTVRRGTDADWRALRDIRLESLADTPDAFGSTYEGAMKWSDRRWRRTAGEWLVFLAERDGEVVGMASGGVNDDHPGTRWLYGMYVTPSARGTGAADALVEAVSDWARTQGVRDVYLHVTTTVARARAFYARMGFVETGEVHVMDRDPRLRLATMVRHLD